MAAPLRRVGFRIAPDEVVVKGFPWNATSAFAGRDHLRGPGGEVVYENRYVIWGQMRWGRLKEYEVYEDTTRPTSSTATYASTGPELAGTVAP